MKKTDFPLITSRSNKKIVEAGKLQDKKYRDENKIFAFEGIKLFEEAMKEDVEFVDIFITESAFDKFVDKLSDNLKNVITIVSDSVYEKLSFENSPQGIFCIAKNNLKKVSKEKNGVIFLDGIQDPNNLGAIIRCADAFDVDKVVLSKGTVDLFNPKTIRSCMGSIFRVPVEIGCDLVEKITEYRKNGYVVYSAVLSDTSITLDKIKKSDKMGFVIGNEGNGVSEATTNACSSCVYIPMKEDGPQSLNAAVASGILMWEMTKK